MFEHGLTHKKYYSVREKIKYYDNIAKGCVKADKKLIEKAKQRLPELRKIIDSDYNNPKLIVTDDKHFNNQIHKPRLCVVVKEDNKGRIMVAPIHHRTSKAVLLENYEDRQIDHRVRLLDKADIYETKYISDIKPLTKSDITHIKRIYK